MNGSICRTLGTTTSGLVGKHMRKSLILWLVMVVCAMASSSSVMAQSAGGTGSLGTARAISAGRRDRKFADRFLCRSCLHVDRLGERNDDRYTGTDGIRSHHGDLGFLTMSLYGLANLTPARCSVSDQEDEGAVTARITSRAGIPPSRRFKSRIYSR